MLCGNGTKQIWSNDTDTGDDDDDDDEEDEEDGMSASVKRYKIRVCRTK